MTPEERVGEGKEVVAEKFHFGNARSKKKK